MASNPLIIPDGYANLTWAWRHVGSPNLASTSLGVQPEPGTFDPSDGLDLMEAAWSELRPQLPTTTVLEVVKITAGSSAPPHVVFERGVDLPGTSVQEDVAPQLCVLARKRTAFAGKPFRGRMYFPCPLGIDFGHAGVIIGSDWSDAVNQFHTVIAEADPIQNVVLFHTESSSDFPPTALLAPGSGLVVENYVATQRRRLRRTSAPAA